jgi:hypothetical protein
MTKPDPRGHHYVPVTLLKRFTDDDGWLHAIRPAVLEAKVFCQRPEELFKQRDLYAVKRSGGQADHGMETALSRFESESERVIVRIVEAARAGGTPSLTAEEEATWLQFLYLQWKRVPDLHLTVTTPPEAETLLDEIFAEARELFPAHGAELDRLSQPAERARTLRNARVDGLNGMSMEVFDAMRSRGLGIVRIRRPDKRFIVGSRPVVKLTQPGKTNLRHPECELWLPIASDVMVGLGRGQGSETLVDCTPENIRHTNLAIAKQSTMFASGSALLTKSVANHR